MTAKEPLRPEEPEFVNEINMLEAVLSRHPPPPPPPPPPIGETVTAWRISLPSSRVTSRPIK